MAQSACGKFGWWAAIFWGAVLSFYGTAFADDPPTEFSKQVTTITGDWQAEDWRKGLLVLHPVQYTWQSDKFLRLYAEEPADGRTAIEAARNHFDKLSLEDDTLEPTLINMNGATDLFPGILAVKYRWSYAFDTNVSFFGIVTTIKGTYVPFHANCETDDPQFPKEYPLEKCLSMMAKLLLFVQGGASVEGKRLVLPQTPSPINIPEWDGQYLKDGTSLVTTGSFNGLRKVLLYASPPRALAPDQIAAALKQFSDGIVYDDDEADKDPGSIRVVGTNEDPWLRREFPEAFEGPSIQMAGTVKTPDGKIVFLGIRCPNKGWLNTCSHGVEQAKLQIKSGQMEQRRQAYVAARQSPIPANGIKTAEVLGIYGEGKFNGSSFVIDGNLFLKDGSVYDSIDSAPQFLDKAATLQKDPSSWGRWRRVGSNIVITWGNGETDTKAASTENLWVGGSPATKLKGYYGTVSSGGSAFGGGWVSRSSYEFFADGTFKNDRSNSFGVNGIGADLAPVQIAAGGSNSSTGKARYEIDGYMISFIYPDGQIEREAFAIPANEANNLGRKYVLIGGTPYTLDNGD